MGRDGIAGLVVLVASVALYWATLPIQGNSLVPVSPAFYPRLVLGITALLAAVLVVSDVVARSRGAPSNPSAKGRPRYGMVVVMFAIVAAYVLALSVLGFRIATFAFVLAMQLAFEPAGSVRRWALVIAVALATTFIAYYTFDWYLQVLLPRGTWTGF
jgi:hypothetical protein